MGASSITPARRDLAFRLKFSARALREIGEAREWYEAQGQGLGEEFLTAIELQLKRLEQAPLLYAEAIAGVRRALLPRVSFVGHLDAIAHGNSGRPTKPGYPRNIHELPWRSIRLR